MKYLRILLVLVIFAALFIATRQAYLYFGRGTLTVNAKPDDASIVVNQKSYNTNTAKNITLSPGEYTIIIALDGFKTIEQKITMGWQDEQTITYQLTPKDFKDIYQNLSPDPSFTEYDAINPRFFLNNTWAAAYIANTGEGQTISVAVIRRVNGAWRLVLHDHDLPENTKSLMPAEVYNYIKDFEG
jgi:hypothetical protein